MANYVEPHDDAWAEVTRIELGGRWVSRQLAIIEFGEDVIRGDGTDVDTLKRAFETWLGSNEGDPNEKIPGRYRVVASWQYSGTVASVAQFDVFEADITAIRNRVQAETSS